MVVSYLYKHKYSLQLNSQTEIGGHRAATKVNTKRGSYGRSPLPAIPNPHPFFSSSASPSLLDACHAHAANYVISTKYYFAQN